MIVKVVNWIFWFYLLLELFSRFYSELSENLGYLPNVSPFVGLFKV